MRIHLGFSKFIKPSKLLYWLGLAFFGLFAWLGLTQQEVLASTSFTNFNLCPYMTGNTTSSYSEYRGQNNITHNNSASYQSTYAYYCNSSPNNNSRYDITTYYNGIVFAVGVSANSSIYANEVSTININTNFCGNVADTNSLDLFFSLQSNSYNTIVNKLNQSYFNNFYNTPSNVNDVVSFYIVPRYQNEQLPLAEYACHLNYEDNNSTLYDLVCEGVPFDSNVLSYDLKIYNNIYSTLENKNNIFYVNTSMSAYDFESLRFPVNLTHYVDYQCSYVEPVNPNQPLFEDDGVGTSDVTVEECESGQGYCSNIPNDTIPNYINLVRPNTLTQFLEFPLYLAQAVVNNHNTCHPIRINFSSLTRRFGGRNYTLTIPCLSTRLQQVFGYEVTNHFTLYDLIDMFIAFYLLYKLAERAIKLIDIAISGQDLVGYLYSGSNDSINDIDNDTGEVMHRKFKRRF